MDEKVQNEPSQFTKKNREERLKEKEQGTKQNCFFFSLYQNLIYENEISDQAPPQTHGVLISIELTPPGYGIQMSPG